MDWITILGAIYIAVDGAMFVIYTILACIKGRDTDDGKVADEQSPENVPTKGSKLFVYGGILATLMFTLLGVTFLFPNGYGFFVKPRTTDPADLVTVPWTQWLFTALATVPLTYLYVAFLSRHFRGEASGENASNGEGTAWARILCTFLATGGIVLYIFVAIGVDMSVRWTWFGIGTFLIYVGVFLPLAFGGVSGWEWADHLVFWPYLILVTARSVLIIIATDILGIIPTEYAQISYLVINIIQAVFWTIIIWQVVSLKPLAVSLARKVGINVSGKYVQMETRHNSSTKTSKKSKHNTAISSIDSTLGSDD